MTLKLHMKKCCNRILIPKVFYKASFVDSIGLAVLLSFFLTIVALIAYGAASWLVSDIESGRFGDRNIFGVREGGGAILLLFGIYKPFTQGNKRVQFSSKLQAHHYQ